MKEKLPRSGQGRSLLDRPGDGIEPLLQDRDPRIEPVAIAVQRVDRRRQLACLDLAFTGKLPDGLFNPIRSASAYLTRAGDYFLLITEDWPPFSLDDVQASAGQLSSEASSRTKS